MELRIRPVQPGDVEAVVKNMRTADRDEVDALVGFDQCEKAMRDGLNESVMAWAGHVGEEVAFVFGCSAASLLGDEGVPWLIGTPLIEQHQRAFIKLSHIYIAKMLESFPILVNIVDARNTKSISWLKKMGFTILPAQRAGVAGLPFHPFFKEI